MSNHPPITFACSASAMQIIVEVKRVNANYKARNGRVILTPYKDAYISIYAIGPTGARFDLDYHRVYSNARPDDFEVKLAECLDDARRSMTDVGLTLALQNEISIAFETLARTCHEEARKNKA